MKRGRVSKFLGMLLCIAILLCLAFAFVFIFKFTNGGKEAFKTFYLTYNGADIVTMQNRMYFEREKELRFDVHYLFDKVASTPTDYTVYIETNEEADFDYMFNDSFSCWSTVGDLSELFSLKIEETYFTFSIPADLSVQSVLERIHTGATIIAPTEQDTALYKLVVLSYDEKVQYEIAFSVFVSPEGFDIDNNHFVF